MTKEELEEKRLPEIVKFGKKHNYNTKDIAKEALYEGYEAGYEAGKPRWHNIKKDGQPPKAGLYLCYRRWHYTDMYELIYWTGEYWVTGSTDYDVIFAWCEIPKFEEE